MKPTREEQFKELVRIASVHLMRASGVDSATLEERLQRFDVVLASAATFPYAKSHVMQKVDFAEQRIATEARFAALGAPLGEIGRWLPKRVLILDEHDAIVEYVSNVDDSIQKNGDICFSTVVNDRNSMSMYTKLHEAMLHYLSSKYEGDNLVANRSFVRHAMAMLKFED